MGISVLNIGIEVMLIVSQKKRSAEVDDTDGLLAHWLAPIGTVMESKRARPHGLWTRPSVSHSLSPHRHELPGDGIRSDCESVLAEGRGDPFKQKIHPVGEQVVAFVLVGRVGLAGGLGSAFGWAGPDLPGARFS
jgi:hypothetical protein